MWSRFLSALFAFGRDVARPALVKFLVFFALFFITTGFVALLVPLLPTSDMLDSALGPIGGHEALNWVLYIVAFDRGITLVLSAAVTGFIIRRIPVIG